SRAAAENRMTLPPAAYGPPAGPSPGTASPAQPAPSPAPGVPAVPTPALGTPDVGASASGIAGQSPPAASAYPQCPSASIVLSMFSTQPRYSPAEQPEFTVYAVSTAAGTCQLSYVPPFARVVVTRNGEVVWDSGSCAAVGGAAPGGAATSGPV